jgi:hypothetical protein
MNWAISGNVLITITKEAGPNVVFSGLFLDPSQSLINAVRGVVVLGSEITASSQVWTDQIGVLDFTDNESQTILTGGTSFTAGVVTLASTTPVDTSRSA